MKQGLSTRCPRHGSSTESRRAQWKAGGSASPAVSSGAWEISLLHPAVSIHSISYIAIFILVFEVPALVATSPSAELLHPVIQHSRFQQSENEGPSEKWNSFIQLHVASRGNYSTLRLMRNNFVHLQGREFYPSLGKMEMEVAVSVTEDM